MSTDKMKWYVIRAISGQENKIKGYIESEIEHAGMMDRVGQILVPTEKVFQVKNGKSEQRAHTLLRLHHA